MHVVGMAVEADGLVVQVQASHVDILILDWRLPGANMPELLKELGELSAPPNVIVLSVNPEAKAGALAAGASAFVGKNAPPDQFLEVVRSFHSHSVNLRN